jgi:hypothetical protein
MRQVTLPGSIDTRIAQGRAKTSSFASSVLGYSQATFYFMGQRAAPAVQLAALTTEDPRAE